MRMGLKHKTKNIEIKNYVRDRALMNHRRLDFHHVDGARVFNPFFWRSHNDG